MTPTVTLVGMQDGVVDKTCGADVGGYREEGSRLEARGGFEGVGVDERHIVEAEGGDFGKGGEDGGAQAIGATFAGEDAPLGEGEGAG